MKIRFLLTAFAVLAIGTVAQAGLITSFETGIGSWDTGVAATSVLSQTSTAPTGAITDGANALKIEDTGSGFRVLAKPDLSIIDLGSGLYDAIELDVYSVDAGSNFRLVLNTAVDDFDTGYMTLSAGSQPFTIPIASGFNPGAWAQLQVLANSSTNSTYYIDNVRYTTSAVPEPATFSLLGLGATLIWSRRRRR